jgi:hypothetical protein
MRNLHHQSAFLEQQELYLDQQNFRLETELEQYKEKLGLARGEHPTKQKTARFVLSEENLCLDL